jgi:hypothetical protein
MSLAAAGRASTAQVTAHGPLCPAVCSSEHAAAAAAAAEESELSRRSTPSTSVETLAAGRHTCEQAPAAPAAAPGGQRHWRRSACEQPAWWEATRAHRPAARVAPAAPAPAPPAPSGQRAQAGPPAPPPPPPPLAVLYPEPEFWPPDRSRRYRV